MQPRIQWASISEAGAPAWIFPLKPPQCFYNLHDQEEYQGERVLLLFACLGKIMLDSKFLLEQNYKISRRINVLAIRPCRGLWYESTFCNLNSWHSAKLSLSNDFILLITCAFRLQQVNGLQHLLGFVALRPPISPPTHKSNHDFLLGSITKKKKLGYFLNKHIQKSLCVRHKYYQSTLQLFNPFLVLKNLWGRFYFHLHLYMRKLVI